MNCFTGVGRLTRDPEIHRNGDNVVAKFTIAIDRKFKNKDSNEREADFPSFVAFGKTAEFIEKYFTKGMKIGVQGRIQTGKYTGKDGNTVYTTDIVVDNAEFVESKSSGNNAQQTAPPPPMAQQAPPVYYQQPQQQMPYQQPQQQQYAQQPYYQQPMPQQSAPQPNQQVPMPGWMDVPPGTETEVPFT